MTDMKKRMEEMTYQEEEKLARDIATEAWRVAGFSEEKITEYRLRLVAMQDMP